jgi:hypothetical protein
MKKYISKYDILSLLHTQRLVGSRRILNANAALFIRAPRGPHVEIRVRSLSCVAVTKRFFAFGFTEQLSSFPSLSLSVKSNFARLFLYRSCTVVAFMKFV